jgi:myo-inositol-1(or 4)-monophosphatase
VLTTDYAGILQVTIDIAIGAGEIVRRAFSRTSLPETRFKGPVNPVTATDTAAEAWIVARLQAHFPDHRILAEEGGFFGGRTSVSAEAGSCADTPIWVVDPLDGTNNFAHGFPHVAVSMALQIGGQSVLGVIHDPLRGETFAGYQGGGCWMDGEPVHVSSVPLLADAFLGAGFPYDRRTALDNNVQRLDHFLRRSQGVRRAGSAALDPAYVACGRLDGFFEIRLSPWDVGAGIPLIREAGGCITDFEGNPDCYAGQTVLASNGHIHSDMLRVIREGADAPLPDNP